MNYITRLQTEVEALQDELAAHRERIQELRGYLLSEKFDVDPTVQVRDVLYRLDSRI